MPPCRGCGKQLESGRHMRTQLSPQGQPWREVRTCDLHCLLDFLESEEEKFEAGKPTQLVWSAPRLVTVSGPG